MKFGRIRFFKKFERNNIFKEKDKFVIILLEHYVCHKYVYTLPSEKTSACLY